jgi:pimeloyl-ACP methyl ester carboxylesterase
MRNKRLALLVLILLLTFVGCKNNDTMLHNNNASSPENSTSETDVIQQSTSDEDAPNTINQQNASNQQSSISPEKSKEIDEFYQNWDGGQIKLEDNNFVNYYSLVRDNSDTLLIYLDGSTYESVMGVHDGGSWVRPGNPYSFAKNHFSEYDFLTLDKVNVKYGYDHSTDPAVINNYTLENNVNSAVSVIDNYLDNTKKEYNEIIIFGISQGGQIMPKVYSQLQNKDKITKLVILGSGGLSQYEDFMILKDSDLPMDPGNKAGYAQVEDAYADIQNNYDSTDKQYFGYTYKMWSGFLKYKPLDDYININIPILILHGAKDSNSPVESARAVDLAFQEAGKDNLKYIEYKDMGHGPESKEQSGQVFGDLADWIENNSNE